MAQNTVQYGFECLMILLDFINVYNMFSKILKRMKHKRVRKLKSLTLRTNWTVG